MNSFAYIKRRINNKERNDKISSQKTTITNLILSVLKYSKHNRKFFKMNNRIVGKRGERENEK